MTSVLDSAVTSLVTLQFGGSLRDALADGRRQIDVHLVRSTASGTPGPTLCGIDRFAPGVGWSLRGGVSGPNIVMQPCPGCLTAAHTDFHGLAVHGLGSDVFAVLKYPALSIRPPWAQLIIGGWKPCENRTWSTDYRGPVIVHASKKWDPVGVEVAEAELVWVDRAKCAIGCYLGVADLVDVHKGAHTGAACTGGCGPWGAPYQYHWVMKGPRQFDAPIPGRGMLGLYRKGIPAETLVAVADLGSS